jgi:AcrR family transcriptional regulator
MQFLEGLERPWKEPTQQRGRDRVAQIVAAARDLIAEGGLANLKMGLLAKRAGVPIGTIYQFFPDKDAVVGRIFLDQMEGAMQEVWADCNPGRPLVSPAAEATAIIEPKFREWRADPVMAEIWSIVQANRTLRHFNLEASRVVGNIMAGALAPFLRPGVSAERLTRVCFMIGDLFDAALRTALDFSQDEAAAYVREYATMIRAHLDSLLVPPDGPAAAVPGARPAASRPARSGSALSGAVPDS